MLEEHPPSSSSSSSSLTDAATTSTSSRAAAAAVVTDRFFENALNDDRFNHAIKNQCDVAAEVNSVLTDNYFVK